MVTSSAVEWWRNKMIEIGRLCVKTAGRDAGKKCLIIDILDGNYVLIDGETRRRKCNIMHIEPLSQKIEIKKNASHDEVAKVLKEIGLEARQTKPKKKTKKPLKKRKTPEQLRVQKEEKKKLRDLFRFRKKEEKAEEKKEATLEEKAGLKIGEVKEEKAGLVEESKVEEKHEHKSEDKKEAKIEKKLQRRKKAK